jgi:anti-anti-sigma factor
MVLQPAERAAVIRLEGSLTARSETRLQEIYREALDLKKPVIVLMFSETATVNGAGIALLTQLVLDAQKEGRRMLVAGASDNHKKMFDIVGFSKLVEFVDALEPGMGCGRETGSAPSWRG